VTTELLTTISMAAQLLTTISMAAALSLQPAGPG
jgi:hypothetical protein